MKSITLAVMIMWVTLSMGLQFLFIQLLLESRASPTGYLQIGEPNDLILITELFELMLLIVVGGVILVYLYVKFYESLEWLARRHMPFNPSIFEVEE